MKTIFFLTLKSLIVNPVNNRVNRFTRKETWSDPSVQPEGKTIRVDFYYCTPTVYLHSHITYITKIIAVLWHFPSEPGSPTDFFFLLKDFRLGA